MENADRGNQVMIDQGNAGPISREDMADGFRTQAWHLMEHHPAVGAYLVLAAAALAPTCADERDVAEEFSDLIADFIAELSMLHARARALRIVEAREVSHGTR